MENIDLIRKIAWYFHKRTGIDWDDLFQEAALIYLEKLEDYDPSKGKLSTYMWHVISSHLKNFIKRWNKYYTPLVKGEQEFDFDSIPSTLPFESEEFKHLIRQPKRTLIKRLRMHGWSFIRIWVVLK
jgi:RNA polymerase sigma factor (sigma-70 family)